MIFQGDLGLGEVDDFEEKVNLSYLSLKNKSKRLGRPLDSSSDIQWTLQ